MGACCFMRATSAVPVEMKVIVKTNINDFKTKADVIDYLKEGGLDYCNLIIAINASKYNERYLSEIDSDDISVSHTMPHSPVKTPISAIHIMREMISTSPSITSPVSCPRVIEVQATSKHVVPTKYQYLVDTVCDHMVEFTQPPHDIAIPTCIFGHSDPYIQEVTPITYADPNIDHILKLYEGKNTPYVKSMLTPVITWAANIVKKSMTYHTLVIMSDTYCSDIQETNHTLALLSQLPLSVIFVGINEYVPRNLHDESTGVYLKAMSDEYKQWDNMTSIDVYACRYVNNWHAVYLRDIRRELEKSPCPTTKLAIYILMQLAKKKRSC